MAFQTREQQVLFALIMLVDILEFVECLPPFEQRGRRVAVIRGFEDPIHRPLKACDGLAQGLVLPAKRVYGMTRKNRRRRQLDQNFPGDLRVQVAHALNLLHRHAIGDEFLLHGHDFGVVGLADQFFQAGPHRIRRIAGVQALDDSLQGAHALCPVVD